MNNYEISHLKYEDINKKIYGTESHVIDYYKLIEKTKMQLFVILSERGACGKTYGAKHYALDRFLENGRPSMLIKNTKLLIDKEKLKIMENVSEEWKKHKYKWVGDWLFCDGKPFIEFVKISSVSAEKGSRLNYATMIYDEFNENTNHIKKKIKILFDSILHSIEDVVTHKTNDIKIFLLGNSISLNTPLLYGLGVTSIKGEIFYVNDTVAVFSNILSDQEQKNLEIKHKNNIFFKIAKQLGTVDHSYYNMTMDAMNGVFDIEIETILNKERNNIQYHLFNTHNQNELIIMILNLPPPDQKKGNFLVSMISKKQIEKYNLTNPIVAIKRQLLDTNIPYLPNIKDNVITALTTDICWFNSIVARDTIINLIR